MTDFQRDADARIEPAQPAADKDKKPISMHENVPVWCDCCSCAAEPYWLAVAEELGIDPDAPTPISPSRPEWPTP